MTSIFTGLSGLIVHLYRAMERAAVVVARVDIPKEIRGRVGCALRIDLQHDVAELCPDHYSNGSLSGGVCHQSATHNGRDRKVRDNPEHDNCQAIRNDKSRRTGTAGPDTHHSSVCRN